MKNHEFFQSGHAILGSLFQTVIKISGFEFRNKLFPIDIPVTVSVNSLHYHIYFSGTEAKIKFSNGISELNR